MKRLRAKLTFSNVVAVMALFIALGGASYAATQLPKNSVGSKQLQKGAVSAPKIKNSAITPAKLNGAAKASLTGPRGAQGAQGPQGPKGEPGSVKAWAEISSGGQVLRSSGGIAAENFDTGFYCIDAGIYTISNSVALATLNFSDGATGLDGQIAVSNTKKFNQCPKPTQFQVIIGRDTGETANMGFIFVIP